MRTLNRRVHTPHHSVHLRALKAHLTAPALIGASVLLGGVILGVGAPPLTREARAQGSSISLGTLSPNTLAQGQSGSFTLPGAGFTDGMTVIVSGGGVTVGAVTMTQGMTPNEQLLNFTLTADPGAALGRRNISVRDNMGGAPVTRYVALEITQGSGGGQGGGGGTPTGGTMGPSDPPPGDPTGDPSNPQDPRYADLPPRVTGQVNLLTRASPSVGETGGQVPLWIEGREFSEDIEIKFSTPLIEQAYNNNQPIPMQVVRNSSDSDGNLDGVMYQIRIAPQALLGPVDITVTNKVNGSSYTLTRGFEIVARGEGLRINTQGSDDITSVSSASPLAIATGRNTAMWVVGSGFNVGSTITFSNPGISTVSPSRPVINSQNNPGFDGIQSFLTVSPTATPGPVDVSVTNPNGSTRTGTGLFSVVNVGAGVTADPTSPNAPPVPADCTPDTSVTVAYLGNLTPNEFVRGETAQVSLIGAGLTCASTPVFPPGINVISAPVLSVDPVVSTLQTLSFAISVTNNAPLGVQPLTVLNPNGSSKLQREAFWVIGSSSAGAACTSSARAGAPTALALLSLLALAFGLARRRSSAT